MQLQGFRPLDRGEFSVSAALTLIAILAAVALFFASFAPPSTTSTSQSAAAPAALPTAKTTDVQKSQICEQKKQQAKGRDESPTLTQPYTGNTTEENKCISAILDSNTATYKQLVSQNKDPKTDAGSYTCFGESTKVQMDTKGRGTIASFPDKSVPAGQCKTQFCDSSGKCTAAKNVSGDKTLQAWATDPDTFKSLSADQQKDVLSYGPIPQSQQSELLKAFQQQQAAIKTASDQLQQASEQCAGKSDNCLVSINQQIAQAAGLTCQTTPDGACVVAAADAARELQAKNDALTAQMKQLAAAKVDLTPTQQPCAGTNCGPTGPGTTGPTPSPTNTNSNGTFNPSSLNSLLSGLAKGLGSSSAAPSAPAAPAQACSTDSAIYAQQQQQYQQALQQYNYQLQQYQYQQQLSAYSGSSVAPIAPTQPTPCTPSTQQQCSLQPQQPSASTCTTGSWQPIYSGNCVTNWQCSNLGAQLSCEPKTADVGMTLAISYSCAQGTASGSGFTASGQSGTATTTVETPPSGTNTATYSLTCTSGTQTAGAQCAIQVTQPSIVLAANPAEVASGETSQIGWITTGMKSCVISSPDDATFTANNSSNTSVNGTAQTPALSATSTSFLLKCQTLSGGSKAATTSVSVK